MSRLTQIRADLRSTHLTPDARVLSALMQGSQLSPGTRQAAATAGAELVTGLRASGRPGLMELFLAEYGLSTSEGVALMCLAEALLRVPDAQTIDELIEDKIAPSDWGEHLGRSSSSLVNASTWALMLTGKVLREGAGVATALRSAVKRLGEPVIRTAVARAIKELGQQFVLGETIAAALRRGAGMQAKGYTYSYDMLGEAAMTADDAEAYFTHYSGAIAALAASCTSSDIRENPGISIKLSALHPRYEATQQIRVMAELVPRVQALAAQARAAGMGLNIDAEEADRLELSMDVIEAVVADPGLAGWDGFGVVVQAYGKRAAGVIDWLQALAEHHDRRFMVRLVKGAYWDTEIKRAQVEGTSGFPVFTTKAATDVSYACCAEQLLAADRLYPQFATHNAHTIALINELAADKAAFEFQRLHGMGEALHEMVRDRHGTRCRIYAPVGAHRDLLAYLVRRLLENGANSSFVNQVLDTALPAAVVAADPFEGLGEGMARGVLLPGNLYTPERQNSRGWDLHDGAELAGIDAARDPYLNAKWAAIPLTATPVPMGPVEEVTNPADPGDTVGSAQFAPAGAVPSAVAASRVWAATGAERAAVLTRAASLYEDNFGELFAILTREAGKALPDAVAELREAVDFLRYYAARGQEVSQPPRGVVGCISPWNFPLAIFSGQIAAALAAGNAVVAKPAEATSLIAVRAVELMYDAGVPRDALQLLPGTGAEVGAALAAHPQVQMMCFTGSTATAQAIHRGMADTQPPDAPLIAETGGLNAMIVDSTALPEQAVRDVIMSAFRSAGQRCSALRMLYVQDDVAPTFLKMLQGAMDELSLGNPWLVETDIGPVIDETAKAGIMAHIEAARSEGRMLHQTPGPSQGSFVPPTLIEVAGISALKREVFGPVLHVARFKAAELEHVVEAINATGFGLTFGIHSRIDDRVDVVTRRVRAGNIYVNRNQIGAIVGSQPFGGEGMSGTGPKAGGPKYVARFTRAERVRLPLEDGALIAAEAAQARIAQTPQVLRQPISTVDLPGPTGESNRLTTYPRGTVLCLGPTLDAARAQAGRARDHGATPIIIAPGASTEEGIDGVLRFEALASLDGIDAVVFWAEDEALRRARQALARRAGPLIPLISTRDFGEMLQLERHICIDTTAAGGNARLLAEAM